eukprot:g15901.t1
MVKGRASGAVDGREPAQSARPALPLLDSRVAPQQLRVAQFAAANAAGEQSNPSMSRGQRSVMSMQQQQSQERERREHRFRSKTRDNQKCYTATLACLMAAALAVVPQAEGQQMDPAAMQRQIQQQMGGSPGGGGAPPPNRIAQLVSAAGAGGASVVRAARRYPRAAVAATAATAAAVYVGKETRRSGLLVGRSPRVSLFRPPDAYLSWVLEAAADAPVASPLRGVVLSPLDDPDAEEEEEEREEDGGISDGGSAKRRSSSRRRVGGGSKRRSSGGGADGAVAEAVEIQAALNRARNVAGEGGYVEETWHGEKGKGRGAVKSVRAGVRVGRGLGIFHKFAQGLRNLDVFDGRSDCELMAAESSAEDVGSILGLLTRTTLGAWSLSPLRVVLRRERTLPVARDEDDGVSGGGQGRSRSGSSTSGKRSSSGRPRGSSSRSRRRRRRGKGKGKSSSRRRGKGGVDEAGEAEAVLEESHRQYTLALSAVEGAGWSGTWVFRVTHDVETDDVWFETRLSQRKGAFGATPGGDQVGRVTRVNQDMLARGSKHAAVLRKREEQFSRVASLARARAKDAKELARDKILHPEKYKRVHRYMREDSHTTGGARARPARWGEERRRNDIRLK